MKKAVEPPAEDAIMVWCGRRACIKMLYGTLAMVKVYWKWCLRWEWETSNVKQWFEMAWKLRNAMARNAETARPVATCYFQITVFFIPKDLTFEDSNMYSLDKRINFLRIAYRHSPDPYIDAARSRHNALPLSNIYLITEASPAANTARLHSALHHSRSGAHH
jgi:hypothetical protein